MKCSGSLVRATAVVAAMLVSGCASIISGGHDDIMVKTDPEGADCTIYRGADVLGHVNPTPGGIVVRRSYDDILVRCVKEDSEGEALNTSGVNGWLFGNIAFGGLIGVIVDTTTANATSYDPITYVALGVKPRPSAAPPLMVEPPAAPTQPVEPTAATPTSEPATEMVAVEVAPEEDTSLDVDQSL